MKKFLLSLAVCLAAGVSANAELITDVLTPTSLGLDGKSAYADYTYKGTSGAEYALQCSNGTDIQLRSNNNSGIVVTKSVGTVTKVEVVWNGSTSATGNRTLNVYGSETAYTAPSDLYATTANKLGGITCGTNTEYTLSTPTAYLGLRSDNGAMYLTSISITWDTDGSTGGETPDPDQPDQPGDDGEYWTVAEALAQMTDGYEGEATVKGIISQIDEVSTSYGNATYYIKDALTDSQALEVFRGYGLDGAKFTDANAIAVGGTVVVSGNLVDYNGTYEFTTGSKILSYTAPQGGETPDPDQPEQPGEPGDGSTVTYDATKEGYANGQDITTVSVPPVTIEFGAGTNSNAPKYYTTGNAVRCYGGNTITVSVPEESYTITSITFTFGSGEGTNAITANVGSFTSPTWTGAAQSVEFSIAGTSGHRRIQTITVTYKEEDGALKPAGLAYPQTAYTATMEEGFTAPELTNPNNLTVTYASSAVEVATVDATTGAVTLLAPGTTIITATSEATETFLAGSASYTLTVKSGEIWTVAQALEEMNAGFEGEATVKGIVSKIDEIDTGNYGNATYYIKDDLNDADALEIYRGYWLDGQKFTDVNAIAVGGTITVEGKLVNYNGTFEFTTGSKVIEYTAPEGGDQPDPDQPEVPGGEKKGVTQEFTTGLGFPEGSNNVVKEATEFTATDTEITYEIYGCYVNSGYLMVNSKTYKEAYISWKLDQPMLELVITTTSGCSENVNNFANVYADGNLVEKVFVGVHDAVITVKIPTEYQGAGTVYKVEADVEAGANEQFASFTYVTDIEEGVEGIQAEDGEAVYFNLQGVKVANPEKGLYIKVVGNKASKVIL